MLDPKEMELYVIKAPSGFVGHPVKILAFPHSI
jgi:hypothetical protein